LAKSKQQSEVFLCHMNKSGCQLLCKSVLCQNVKYHVEL